jgi:hypothetical protein
MISQINFGMKLHVSDSSSVHHQQLFTVHSAMVYVIQVCRQLSSRVRMELHLILVYHGLRVLENVVLRQMLQGGNRDMGGII